MVDDLIDVSPGVSLRPVVEADRDFLLALYGSTRADELSVVSWTLEERSGFVTMQFEAQDAAYRQTFPAGRFMVVLADGVAVGRLSVARLDGEVRIVDIALTAESRGRGIGTGLLAWVVADADRDDLPVTLHVEPSSRAVGLYGRLGFEVVEHRGIDLFMRRTPPRQLKTAS